MENEKYLFVVSGAAGTGKDSVVSALRKAHPEIEKTVSATTRSPRPGEQEGVDYYYRTKEQFQQLIDQDEVVEHNFFNGNYYGTLKEEVNKRLNAGKLVVMVIDVHGAANIRRMYPGATTIFLLPPSTQELERRLRGRGTETEESIRERLEIVDHDRRGMYIQLRSLPPYKDDNQIQFNEICIGRDKVVIKRIAFYRKDEVKQQVPLQLTEEVMQRLLGDFRDVFGNVS